MGTTDVRRHRLRQASREAGMLLLAACALGLVYNGVTRKGIFASDESPSTVVQREPSVSPTFLTFDEAIELHHSKQALFVDSRHAFDYRLGHIEGAINIPLNEISQYQDTIDAIPRESIIVVYCDGQECNSSIALAKHFAARGFLHVNIFFGGWREWQTRHQPTE